MDRVSAAPRRRQKTYSLSRGASAKPLKSIDFDCIKLKINEINNVSTDLPKKKISCKMMKGLLYMDEV